jgi:N-acyl-L-homoserine lactone synthetase
MASVPAHAAPGRAAHEQPASAAEPSRTLAPERLDELARAMVTGAAPLRFTVATHSREIGAACRLRCAHIMAAGWGHRDGYPDGQERDDYDDAAVHVIAWDQDRPVGTCRIVRPSRRRRLPVEQAFGITVTPAGKAVEWGRLVVSRHCSGDCRYNVTSGLLGRAWLETRSLGFHVIAGAASLAVIRLYRRMGFQVVVLGDGQDYWGERRYPVRSATAAGVRRWSDPRLTPV